MRIKECLGLLVWRGGMVWAGVEEGKKETEHFVSTVDSTILAWRQEFQWGSFLWEGNGRLNVGTLGVGGYIARAECDLA
eukprot:scaffold14784_cov234-Alexandrium_tamarense.AAC.5